MDTLFLFCAVIGGTVMILQFVLTALGLSDDGGDLSDVGDVGDIGDVDVADGMADVDEGGARFAEAADADVDGSASSRIFGMLSLRTVVAAITFFGMAGKASLAAQFTILQSTLIAVAAGAAALYAVYALMRGIQKLRSEGNVRISGAVGLRGTVYLPIPANREGAGKIQLNLQNRTVEYQAMTAEEAKLPAGARIVVTSVLGPDTVAVERIPETVDVAEESC